MDNPEKEFKFVKPGEVRTRIAPSPTGFLHIGIARTALFNYLFAKKNQGSFIVRVEDTDIERSRSEWEKNILNSLKWLDIEWDEGPDVGGDYGPYRQSEKLEIYSHYLKKLLSEKKAYHCFCSKEDLEAQKQYLMSQGRPPLYNGKCAQLSDTEINNFLKQGKKFILRFKTPTKKVVFKDLVREDIEFDAGLIGDFSLARDFHSPLYNFACVIDDFEMKISHVIRGEDHISNTPKQILIQEALGFSTPQYAHLPLILGTDRAKLSKRHGSISIEEFKKAGYLPEALLNFMALLGWNPGTEREIYSMNSLIKEFSLERVKRGGAVFNIKRLDFLNSFYLRQKSIKELTEDCLLYLVQKGLIEPIFESRERVPDFIGYFGKEIVSKYLVPESGEKIDFEYLQKIVSIYQERLKKISEIPELVDFFFKKKLAYKKELLKWKNQTEKEINQALDKLQNILSKVEEPNWSKETLEKTVLPEAEKFAGAGDRGYLLWPLRVALTGKEASAGPFEIAEILGKEKVIKRIKEAKDFIKESN